LASGANLDASFFSGLIHKSVDRLSESGLALVLARCRLRDDTGPEDQECQNAGGRGEDG
jgi:hypothetical protein